MSSVDGVLSQYRNLTGQHLQELWDQILYKQGIKGDVLRDVIMFYFQHKVFPPPPQKVYDTLLTIFVAKGTSKKIKNILFHIVEELCPSLQSNIVESVRFSTNSISTIELINSVLIGRFVQELDESTIERLLAYVTSESLSSEESGKLLLFLNRVAAGHPSLLPKDYVKNLGELMAGWLCNSRAVVSGSSQFFSRSDKTGGIEVDGTQLAAGDIFTVLTLANNFSKNHIMGIHSFSLLRDWLENVEPKVPSGMQSDRGLLLGLVREYCSLSVRQCLRQAQSDHDKSLQKAVLCQVLDILFQLVQLDKSQHLQSLLVVKRVQRSVVEHFRSDPRDVSIFVRLLTFLLQFGEATENQQPFCEQFLGDTVHRSYSSDLAAFDIADFLMANGLQCQSALLGRFFPNLLKLVACHPSSLIEEFMQLVPQFVEPHTAIEVFHSLLDLPVLSATLCLHQVSTVLQQDKTTSPSPAWVALLDNVQSPVLRPSFNYMLRKEAAPDKELPARAYVKSLQDLTKHSLVVTCSEIVPLLVDAFFVKVETLDDSQINANLLCAILKKIRLIYNVPGYSTVMHKYLTEHFQEIVQNHPELVFSIQPELVEYVSVLDNNEICPRLYFTVVWLVGLYASPGHSRLCSPESLTKYYETLECVLYETLAQITSEEKVSLNLLCVMSSTLAKLASRQPDLIPRLLLCYSKLQRQVATRLHNVSEDEKQSVLDRVEELIGFLKNPNIASPSMSMLSSHEVDPAMTAFLQILAQVTDAR